MIGQLFCRLIRLMGGSHKRKRVTVDGSKVRACERCGDRVAVKARGPRTPRPINPPDGECEALGCLQIPKCPDGACARVYHEPIKERA